MVGYIERGIEVSEEIELIRGSGNPTRLALFQMGVTSRPRLRRSELARELRRLAGDRFIREQARSYTGAGDWLRPIEAASRVIR